VVSQHDGAHRFSDTTKHASSGWRPIERVLSVVESGAAERRAGHAHVGTVQVNQRRHGREVLFVRCRAVHVTKQPSRLAFRPHEDRRWHSSASGTVRRASRSVDGRDSDEAASNSCSTVRRVRRGRGPQTQGRPEREVASCVSVPPPPRRRSHRARHGRDRGVLLQTDAIPPTFRNRQHRRRAAGVLGIDPLRQDGDRHYNSRSARWWQSCSPACVRVAHSRSTVRRESRARIEGAFEVVEFPSRRAHRRQGANEPRYPALKGIMAPRRRRSR